MRSVFIFHGTGGNPQGNWFPWLKKELEQKDYQVFVLKFPNPENPSFTAWFDLLQNYKQYIDDQTIMVGHSLGGLFLLRVLERLSNPIFAAFFVSAPIGIKPIRYYDSDYRFSGFSFNWQLIKSKAENFSVFHSDNDPYVSLANGKELAKKLGVQLHFIPNAGHLNAESGYTKFDELLQEINHVLM